MNKKNKIMWTIVGFLMFLVSIVRTLDLFKIGHDRSYQAVQGFYEEKNNQLDAVYIGASSVHCFWEPPLGWNDRGIAVWSLSLDSMPASAVKYMIEEARKTQPNALYIISINNFKFPSMPVNYVMTHRITDYMDISLNKLKQINWLADKAEIPIGERLEFIFPIIRFHSRWNKLEHWDFTHSVNGLKKGIDYWPYNVRIMDLTDKYVITDEIGKPTKKQTQVLTDLLDYCDQEGVNALFVLSPQKLTGTQYRRINALENIIRERGYPCWDLLKITDDLGIQIDTDFYNYAHTNVHGSMKFIDYLGERLVEEYGFTDKRGQPGWESWDKSVELYTDVIGPYTLPIERSHEMRDYNLSAPVLSRPKVDGAQLTLTWTLSEGAEFYEIYRKSTKDGDRNWRLIDSVDGTEVSYTESNLYTGVDYTYTVVPGYTEDDVKYYGKFDYTGVIGKNG